MMNIRDNISLPNDKKKNYKLIPLEDTSKYLSSAYLGVKDFFKILRSSPKLMYKILTKAEQKDFNNPSFIYFITNNFYNNILSSKTYSEELLSLITHLLYDQISDLKKISDFPKLFQNSNVFSLLKGLKYKNEIQSYFGLVLSDVIEEYENSENNARPLVFKIDNLLDFIQNEEISLNYELNNSVEDKKKEIQKKQSIQLNEFNKMFKMKLSNYDDSSSGNTSSLFMSENGTEESENKDSLDEGETFLTKYLIELKKCDLIDKLNEETCEIMKNFIQEQLKGMDSDEKYSNSKFLDEIQKSKETEKLLYNYKKNFYIVIEIINKIIKKFNETIDLIPYTIKYICKIISVSLKKKFKGISQLEIYNYVGEFFLVFIFQDFFLNPDYGTLITSIIISQETKKNLLIIFEIWKKLISFKFYINNKEYGDYTPFNWFFLESINNIINICQKILDINLPDSFNNDDKFDNRENKNFMLNINNNSSFFSYSICYNIYNLTALLNIIKNNTNYFFENKSTRNEIAEFEVVYRNLKNKKDIFKKLKSNEGQTVNYYIYYEVFYSKKFQDILFKTIKQGNNFSIDEIKNPSNEEEKYLNKIIKSKNLLCELLFKSENLFKIKFNKENINFNNTEEIISLLSAYYQDKSVLNKCYSKFMPNDIDINYNDTNIDMSYTNNINSDLNSLPLYWYSNTLLSCFQELNEDENNKLDFHKLFSELTEDINNSMNIYNFEELAQALESLKNTRVYTNNFIENQEKYKNININTKIRNFIEHEKIEVEIKFRYNKETKLIYVTKTEDGINSKFQKLDEFLNQTQKDKVINCSSISEFIKKFPNLSEISKKHKIDTFLIEKEIKVKRSLLDFLKIVKEHIKKAFEKEEIENVYSKVKRTIMVRLYDKLFPKKPDLEDVSFYNQCLALSWIEPKHLKQEKLFFDNFLPITTSYFEQINNEKSASGKLEVICKIFDAINSVIIFNKGGNFSTDDIAPICEYALIKAHPNRFSSNLKYLQIFMKKDEDLKERMYFDYLKAYVNIIKKSTYLDFYDVTKDEFYEKCQEIKDKMLQGD